MKNKDFWIAEVKWTKKGYLEKRPYLKGTYPKGIKMNTIEYFGPFTKYDTGAKVWSTEFSDRNEGKIEYINIHKLENI